MLKLVFRKVGLPLVIMAFFTFAAAYVSWAQQQIDEERLKILKKKQQMVKAVKKALDGTTWEITLTETGQEGKRKVINDTLNFKDGKIKSKHLSSEGFNRTNFSVRTKKELIIWETMQNSEEGGVAFWRGEIRQEEDPVVMRGILSRHIGDETTVDYSFLSEEREEPFEIVIEEEEEEQVVEKKEVEPVPPAPPKEEPKQEAVEEQVEEQKEPAEEETSETVPGQTKQEGALQMHKQEVEEITEETEEACQEDAKEEAGEERSKIFFWRR